MSCKARGSTPDPEDISMNEKWRIETEPRRNERKDRGIGTRQANGRVSLNASAARDSPGANGSRSACKAW